MSFFILNNNPSFLGVVISIVPGTSRPDLRPRARVMRPRDTRDLPVTSLSLRHSGLVLSHEVVKHAHLWIDLGPRYPGC